MELHFTGVPKGHIGNTIEEIHRNHKKRFGSDYIGYHYLIDFDGKIYQTRPLDMIASADNKNKNNYNNIHVSYMGDDKPNGNQILSIFNLKNELKVKDTVAHYNFNKQKSKKESLEYMFGGKEKFQKEYNEYITDNIRYINKLDIIKEYENIKKTYITATEKVKERTQEMTDLGRRLTEVGRSQKYIKLESVGIENRVKELLRYYGLEDSFSMWKKTSEKRKIKLPVLICIARAESTMGKEMTTKNNPGNIGNTNSGRRQSFDTLQEGIDKIGQTLNNQYLGSHTQLVELNETWRLYAGLPSCHNSGVFCYSMVSKPSQHKFSAWMPNVKNCLSMIYQEDINGRFKFRLAF